MLKFIWDVPATLFSLIHTTFQYFLGLYYFIVKEGSYADCPYFTDSVQARVHLYSLSLVFYLWDRPHYRNGTFQQDQVKNLRNVAVPGTGIPLSLFTRFKATAYLFLLVAYPMVALVSAVKLSLMGLSTVAVAFKTQLLEPEDWFSFWRLNCRLASYHSLLMGDKAPNYLMENKWDFLVKANEHEVPVSPFWKDPPRIVVKDKNEEGGMGIKFFDNASHGGEWIIQEAYTNSKELAKLLPKSAPLSTFRVITASTLGLPSYLNAKNPAEKLKKEGDLYKIHVMSCVFRAGRDGSLTDHSSILFDVNTKTKTLGLGTTNDHWYKLGPKKALETPWISQHNITHHPDGNIKVTGKTISNFSEVWNLCKESHHKLLPDVPMAGWDVAITDKGMFLLEVNLSCNFFRGTFSKPLYFSILDRYMKELELVRLSRKDL